MDQQNEISIDAHEPQSLADSLNTLGGQDPGDIDDLLNADFSDHEELTEEQLLDLESQTLYTPPEASSSPDVDADSADHAFEDSLPGGDDFVGVDELGSVPTDDSSLVNGSEDVSQDRHQLALQEAAEQARAALEGYGGFETAREFLNNNGSMSKLGDILSPKSALDLGESEMAPLSADEIRSGAFRSQQPAGQQQNAHSGDLPRVSGMAALSYMGAAGVRGLANMVYSGGNKLTTAINEHRWAKDRNAFDQSLSEVSGLLQAIDKAGLTELVSKTAEPERKAVVDQFFSDEGNKQIFDRLIDSANDVQRKAIKLATSGLKAGHDEDSVFSSTVAKIADLTEKNKALLKELEFNKQSLLSRFDDISNSVFAVFKQAMVKLAQWVHSVATPKDDQSMAPQGPKMG